MVFFCRRMTHYQRPCFRDAWLPNGNVQRHRYPVGAIAAVNHVRYPSRDFLLLLYFFIFLYFFFLQGENRGAFNHETVSKVSIVNVNYSSARSLLGMPDEKTKLTRFEGKLQHSRVARKAAARAHTHTHYRHTCRHIRLWWRNAKGLNESPSLPPAMFCGEIDSTKNVRDCLFLLLIVSLRQHEEWHLR
ncbi:Uncharacterized protein APZ42_027149 [Daphnia magna]|uniref:Uncharacterized protein n=1 Tax=Daphnia magna TaxID=35525 RepID=A0A164RBD9_9CRUS|nr:Uncharacterized protein APZ42_027149 [Daphnia magna]